MGLTTSDERVLKLVSVVAEAQLCKILSEAKSVNIQGQKEPYKTHLSFEDLSKALEEFGVALRRPPFLEDKARVRR